MEFRGRKRDGGYGRLEEKRGWMVGSAEQSGVGSGRGIFLCVVVVSKKSLIELPSLGL